MDSRDETVRFLRTLFAAGDVFEIRALEAVTAEYQRPHAESGYFDYDHIPQAAEAIAKLRSCSGAYVTLNPVNPALLGRANNRIAPARRDNSTADGDVLRRRWLPIDCDPVRPSGIASTDAEHEAALALAREIRDGLSSLGWPEPVMLDSGNGAQMLYRIDLPTDDDGLVKRCIEEIAKASTEAVKVDVTVFNAARIWRVAGTMNRKGDPLEDRPHRMARIVSVPKKVVTAKGTLLEAVCGNTPAPTATESAEGRTESPHVEDRHFDLDRWIAEHLPEAKEAVPWQGGRKWILTQCPFNPEHKGTSVALVQPPDGGPVFCCKHNGCAGNDWHKLRELREPGCYDHPQAEPLPLDWGALGSKAKDGLVVHAADPSMARPQGNLVEIPLTPPEPERPWRKVTKEDVEEAIRDTALGELARIYSSVTRPPLPLECSLVKAIVTAGCCLSGEESPEGLNQRYGGNLGIVNLVGADRARVKIDTSGGQLCNVYGLVVAPSATGKDIGGLIGKFARMTNPDLHHIDLSKCKPDWNLASSSSSAEGLAGMLVKKPNGLLSISEMSIWLDKNNWQYKAADFLTEVYSQGFFDQSLSERARGSSGSRSTEYCAPNIMGSIQPDVFNEKVNMQDIATGFLGRFLMTRLPEYYGNPAVYDGLAKQKELADAISPYLEKHGVVSLEEGYSDALQEVFMGKCPQRLTPSWRRLCNEYYPRLMVMLSVTNDVRTRGREVIITEDTRTRARTLVLWLFSHAERILSGIVEGEGNGRLMEKALKRLFCIIRDYGGEDGIAVADISRKASGSGTNAKDRRDLLDELCERGWAVRLENKRYAPLHPPIDLMRPEGRPKS